MTAQAFIDESARGRAYHLCAAIVDDRHAKEMRTLARSFCLSGQRRWHFVNERNSRRRQIVDALVASGRVCVLDVSGLGHQERVRAECLRRMVGPLASRGVTRVSIESRDGRDHLDRRVMMEPAQRATPTWFKYDHLPPHAEPLLWVADAFAWCASAGGLWRERTDAVTERWRVFDL